MRVCIAALFCAAAIVNAEDFKLNNGLEYQNVKISRIEPDGIMIVTRTGIVKLFFNELPKEIQEKYHYDPKKAEAFRFRLDAARDAAAEEITAAKERRRQEFAGSAEGKRHSPERARPRERLSGLSIEAHEVGTGDGTFNRWYIDPVTYSRDFLRQKTLLITVRDFSRSVPAVTIHVCFIGHPTEREVPLFVYGHVVVPVELKGDLEVSGTVDAPPLDAHITNLGGVRYVHGSDIDGWIVVGEVSNQWFQVRASRQRLLDLAERKPEQLAEMIAAYDDSTKRRR